MRHNDQSHDTLTKYGARASTSEFQQMPLLWKTPMGFIFGHRLERYE